MVGRHITPPGIDPPKTRPGLLEVEGLSLASGDGRKLLDNIRLRVDYGEIVGVAGVSGNGQRELVRCLTGIETEWVGSVKLGGRQLAGKNVAQIRECGIAHIPEDRYADGSAAEATLAENTLMGNQHRAPFSRRGVLRLKTVYRSAAGLIQEYGVKATSVHQKMRELSGGNAQKLVAAREIAHNTSLLVASEPTRGIDVGAMEFIHQQLLNKRGAGDGILLISSELSEVMKLSDRIYVLYEGHINGEFSRGEAGERELGLLMVGGRTDGS
jgi:simple sugar transport system ATP-binding protein